MLIAGLAVGLVVGAVGVYVYITKKIQDGIGRGM